MQIKTISIQLRWFFVSNGFQGLKNITIFNLLGQKLLSTTENKLNIENLKDGAYLLKMETISSHFLRKKFGRSV